MDKYFLFITSSTKEPCHKVLIRFQIQLYKAQQYKNAFLFLVRVLITFHCLWSNSFLGSTVYSYTTMLQCYLAQFVSGPLKGQGHSVLWKPTSQFTTEEDRWYHVIYYYFERGIYLAPSVFGNSENRDHLMPNICFYKINFL